LINEHYSIGFPLSLWLKEHGTSSPTGPCGLERRLACLVSGYAIA